MTVHAPRILICRLSHIGDCVLTIPMVTELRRAIPDARITWAMESPSHKLLQGHPAIDEILLIPRRWLKSLGTIGETRRMLRKQRFDISIDPQSILKSALLARLSGAKTRLGFDGVHGREQSTWLNNCRVVPESTHLVDRSLELIRPLVNDSEFRGFQFPISADATRSVQRHLNEQGVGPWVVINPGASWPSKRWENDRFADVARALFQQPGIRSVVSWSGDAEQAMAEEIVDKSAGAAIMAPPTSLPELAALMHDAALFVGCDTGPMHIAVAAGTRCVGLYGPTRPQDSGAYGQQHIALQARYQAGSCRQRRGGTNEAMREIDVPQVVAGCREALKNTHLAASDRPSSATTEAA